MTVGIGDRHHLVRFPSPPQLGGKFARSARQAWPRGRLSSSSATAPAPFEFSLEIMPPSHADDGKSSFEPLPCAA